MDRLIATNSVPQASADTAPAIGTPQFATDGNPASGIPATIWPAYAWNAIQEEMMAVLSAAGVTPDRTNNAQVLAALRALFAALNGNSGEPFAASQFTVANGITSTGPALLLQNNGYVGTVNEANSGYVEMYVAPATVGQAAVNLSQFAVSGSASNGGVTTNISTSASFTPTTKCLVLINGNVGSTEGITSCGLSFTGAASTDANQSNWSGGGGTTVSSLGASTAQITVDAGTACTITMSAASAGSMTIGFNFIGIPVQ